MDSVALLELQFQQAHEWLEATVGEVTTEQLAAVPSGTANPIGASYAHAVLVADAVVNATLRGSTPLFDSVWAGKNGLSEPMPMPGPEWARYFDWTRNVRLDLPLFRRYAAAVYRDAGAYIAALEAADLDRGIDLSVMGLGTQSVGWILGGLLLGHLHDLTGEIAAVRGAVGLKGYLESAGH